MSLLRTERHGTVSRLILSDETSRNSLSEPMLNALIEAFDDENGPIIIASEGKAFCAGHNLKELTAHRSQNDGGEDYFVKIFDLCAHLMTRIATHPCPVIAEVNGLASAAGCQLVATCDLAFASEGATFCTPGVNIGLFCSTPMVALSRSVAHKHAMEMLLTGNIFDAQFAYRAGLVNAVVPAENLSRHVMDIAEHIVSRSMAAIKFGKSIFHEQRSAGLTESYDLCSAVMVENILEPSAQEGIGAFLEKRKAIWPPRQ